MKTVGKTEKSVRKKKKALVVSETTAGFEAVSKLLSETVFLEARHECTAQEARDALAEGFDLLVVNTPLKDGFGDSLAVETAAEGVGVIMLVKEALYEEAFERVASAGVVVLAKPFTQRMFTQAVNLLISVEKRIESFAREQKKLQGKLEELGVVARAKVILVEYLRMSEEQAHHYIEKQAMDLRTSKKEVAEGILRTYDK